MMETEVAARHQAVKNILRTQRVGTQEELVELLAKRGFDVTQATLSRDLAKIKARRAALPEGGTIYELAGEQAPETDESVLAALRHLVVSVDHNDSLVVVKTTPGGASAVAMAIDRARLNTILGSIAGDDTIFVAPGRKGSAAGLTKQLQSLWSAR